MPPAKRTARKRTAAKPTAPHLVEPQLKHITDATFVDFHKAIARGFHEPHHPELLELPWSEAQERRYRRFAAGVRALDPLVSRLPRSVRLHPIAARAFGRAAHPSLTKE